MTNSLARSGNASSWRRGSRSRLALAAVSVGALALTMGSAGAASADQAGQPHSIYVFPQGTSGPIACLDILGGSAANGTPVQVYKCDFKSGTTASQTWTEVTGGSTVRSVVSGKCLDVVGGGKAAGTKVDMYTCNGTGAQVWERNAATATSAGTLYNPQSGKCLDVPNAATSGVQLQIWNCTRSSNQIWEQRFGK
ncbi:ricin-type beta-trefoil lectin domain protein [Streptomyces sp. NPDC102441]|uniref:ricin-type beta-trefoil lectin domain protein n=1 Tax=Streptomyces sp. NPDC102441 TaxID=3366176 RepID=UPI00382A0294